MFRPCIDLHGGRVKQVVGSTLRDGDEPVTNFVADRDAAWFAERFRADGLAGGHVIRLGPGNDDQAASALAAYPGGLQLGGGVTPADALDWLERGASHVIVTSWLFEDGLYQWRRLDELAELVGPQRLVVDLSARRDADGYRVFVDRWQRATDLVLDPGVLTSLEERAAELLVHAIDVEGMRSGIDTELVRFLADHCPLPVTYAGGARHLDDLALVTELGRGRVDLTIGSALDLFGGDGVRYRDVVEFNRAAERG
ncbi:MAG: phosphoribosylformimino-5-aminoimidazole carboxamide ribotide isomerase [Actinomycetota bacterium]|nr:phosphoribosylformimino-5-aminoimidazole carboxamide ribotide isomerase [Actinomycetota bacterium]